MQVTMAQGQKILTGNLTFSVMGFSMLVTRLKGVYKKDSSQPSLKKCVDEINSFIQKYGKIMLSDIEIISKL